MGREDLERLLSCAAPPIRREALALFELYDDGALPVTNHFVAGIPYSLENDFGAELREHFASDEATATATGSVGVGFDGGGMTYFLMPDGTIDMLYMGELPYYWQRARFGSLGQMCWVLFHATAADNGRFPGAQWEAAVRALGCERAAVWAVRSVEVLAPTLALEFGA